jgi:hypothetical protein
LTILLLITGWSVSAGLVITGSVWYLHHGQLERPALGVFDGGDLIFLLAAIVLLPFVYLKLPVAVCTALLLLGVLSPLFIGLQPWLPTRAIWAIILLLVAALFVSRLPALAAIPLVSWLNILLSDGLLIAMVIVVANTYAQGGLRLRPLAWGMLVLAIYDGVFAWALPVTPLLFAHFAQAPLAPIVRIPFGPFQTSIGLGDLLAFATYSTVAYKSFGGKGLTVSAGLIACCGILLPAVVGWWLSITSPQLALVFPLQVSFGPAAFIASWWLARIPERTVGVFRVQQQEAQQRKMHLAAMRNALRAESEVR